MALIRQSKRERSQVQEVTPKFISLFRLARFRSFGDEVCLIRIVSASEALQRPLAIDVFNANSWAILIPALLAFTVGVLPNAKRKTARKPPTSGQHIVCEAREIERQIESNE